MATLADIRQKVRNITGRPSENQLPTATIDFYINNYYTLNFPDEFRTLQLKQYYEIVVVPNTDTYNLDPQTTFNYPLELETTCWVAGRQIMFHQDPVSFYRIWPETAQVVQVATGNGGSAYTGTLIDTPVVPGTVVVSDGTLTNSLTDLYKDGNLVTVTQTPSSPLYGTVNYLTGALTINFPTASAVGSTINGEGAAYVAGQPTDVLFYNQQFVFRPVPDKSYLFKIQSYVRPTQLASDNPAAVPNFIEWWEMIAMGAALKVFEDNGDIEQYTKYYPIYEKYKDVAQRRTLKQIAKQRAQTIYADQGNYAFGPFSNYTAN